MSGVPVIAQKDYYCGPAALAMVLKWSGQSADQNAVAALSFSPASRGTYRADMIGASRRLGQLVVALETPDQLFTEVAAGHPVIVFQNLSLQWAPRWHYAAVVGYDTVARNVLLHSGELERTVMDFGLFSRTWARGENWAIVVLPPGRLPALDDQSAVLRAAAALEDAGQHRAAAATYRAGEGRWPDNWLWPFGSGNAAYALGDLAASEAALVRAQRISPEIPEIRQNLAQVRREAAR